MSNFFNSWQFYAFASAVFAALTAIFGKIGVSKIDSDLATFLRTVVILGITALVVTLKAEWKRPEELSMHGLTFLVLSGIATGMSWLCYYKALQLGPASKVAPIDKLSVVMVVLLSAVVLGEVISWKVAVGAVMITAGVIVIALG